MRYRRLNKIVMRYLFALLFILENPIKASGDVIYPNDSDETSTRSLVFLVMGGTVSFFTGMGIIGKAIVIANNDHNVHFFLLIIDVGAVLITYSGVLIFRVCCLINVRKNDD